MRRLKWVAGTIIASVLAVAGIAAPVSEVAAAAAACATRVPGDFNGDGYADVAIGEPLRTVGGIADAGAVRIVDGSPSGVRTTGSDQYFDQDTAGIAGKPTPWDNFGWALATGYFNGDCYADLAIGTPGEDDVTILDGSAAGLAATGIVITGPGGFSGFGLALASGDFNGDGYSDLVAGAPGATVLDATDAGEIGIAYGSSGGLGTPAYLSQSTSGVPGVSETDDEFGYCLVAADFTGDHIADLAIGTPDESNGAIDGGGAVTILTGSAAHGLTSAGAKVWTQDTAGVPGADEAHDGFGSALAAGDVNGDGRADLIVGTPGEGIGSVSAAGAVTFLAGAATGLTATGSKSFSQDTGAVPGTAEHDDRFGASVAAGDFDGDGRADIVIGAPSESLGGLRSAGDVTILRGTTSGPADKGAKAWSQDTAGIGGTAEPDDLFGFTLAALHVSSPKYATLVIGVPEESTAGHRNNGAVNVLAGSAAGLTSKGSQYFAAPADSGGPGDYDDFGLSLG